MTCEERLDGEREKTPQADRIKSRVKSSDEQKKPCKEMDEIVI